MGNEIAKLKNENKRTKTSIQRMKSFQNHQRKVRAAMRDQNGEVFLGQDVILDKRGRLVARESDSKCDSERRHAGFIVACDWSNGSAGAADQFDGHDNHRSSDE